MNMYKREKALFADSKGIKHFALLFIGALVSALPFMTKSLVPTAQIVSLTAIFGWIGLSLLFVTLLDFRKSLKRVLYSLFCFFFVFYFFVYSWFISLYPLDFAGFGKIESIGVILIPVTLIPLIHSAIMTFGVFLGYLAARKINNDALRVIVVSFGYVIGEYLQSVGTFAFPWTRLFVGQTAFPCLLQTASLFGSYFITFIMVLVNAFLALSLINANDDKKKSLFCFSLALAVFVTNLGYGLVRINFFDYTDLKHIDALVLQGNIPSGVKWSGDVDEKEIYLDLAEYAKDYKLAKEFEADIAVMPETAFPYTLTPYDGFDTSSEKTLMQISDILDAELFTGAFNKEDGKSYNSIFVYNKDGIVTKPYNKNNIVPFGEYLPYRRVIETLLPVLAEINMLSHDLAPGLDFMPRETEAGKAACLVCFDSIFPETARKQVKNGAEFIVVTTNDSWYKKSSAIYQHADHAIMRAIENNRPVIRSANTGVSMIITANGFVQGRTDVDKRDALYGSAFIPQGNTLYTQIGDIIVPISGVCILIFLLCGIFAKKKASHKSERL